MRKMITFVFCSLLLTSMNVQADGVIKSDFFFPLKSQDYTRLLTSHPQKGSEVSSIPKIEFNAPFKTSVLRTQLQFDYDMTVATSVEKIGRFDFQLDIASSVLSSEQVITDGSLTKIIGGIHIEVFLKGQCRNIRLESLSPLKLSGNFDVSPNDQLLGAQLAKVELHGLTEWKISMGACEGPVGFQHALEAELRKLLKDKNYLQGLFKDQLQKKLDTLVSDALKSLIQEKTVQLSETVSLTLTPQDLMMNPQNGQLVVRGVIGAYIKSDKHMPEMSVASDWNESDEKLFQQSGFVIPQKFVMALSSAFYQTSFYNYDFTSNTFDALKSFFSNRFFQWFLWPDLLKFGKGEEFKFSVSPEKQPNVASLGAKNGYVWYSLKAPLKTQIKAPRDGGYVPYVNVLSQSSMYAWLGVYKGKALVGFHNVVLDSQKQWDAEYVKKYKPYKSLSLGFFVSKVRDMILQKRFLLDLPVLQIGDTDLLAPHSLQSDEKWVQLIYSPTKGN